MGYCEYFKADDAINTIMSTKLGCQALESGQNSLYEKERMTIILDDAMHFDVKHMNGQRLSEETAAI